MVRNYVKKKDTEPKYSEDKLQRALHEIRAGTITTHKASVVYKILFATVYCRIKGTRGAFKKSKGRRTALPENVENVLATSVKTLAKWGFGLSRKEILELVGQYVSVNKIETPFKGSKPGEDWFLNFKRRHNLSIRKPEQLEYARKKAATDPFIILGYFSLLKKILTELNLENRPQQIWNLDESSLSIDPSKSKIVGERGESSSRVISTSGRENTTFVLAANAAGGRAPPLIIFKAKNIWDQWKAPPDKEYPGTAYAATPNGWMETGIFKNYFERILVPALGDERPVLVIYDGHSTHVSLDLVELALAKEITILKLPAHTSDLLQPLDLSVFKSFKQRWDQSVATWQRQHIGQKLPKSLFSQFLGETWLNVSEDVIMSGFRKAGIFPFNPDVIPRETFSKDALERWKMHEKEIEGNALNIMELAKEVEPGIHLERSQNSSPSIINLPDLDEANPNTLQSLTADSENPQKSTPNSKEKQAPVAETMPSISLEQMILSTIQQKYQPNKQKKRKVASGAEVVTSTEMVEFLRNKDINKVVRTKPNKKTKKNTKTAKKGKVKRKTEYLESDGSSTNVSSESEVPYANSDESELVEEETEDPINSDIENIEEKRSPVNENQVKPSHSATREGNIENELEEVELQYLDVNKWVLVKYALKKRLKYYVGVVQKKVDSRWEVKFVRRKGSAFVWPVIDDTDNITAESIVKILPNPEITKRGIIHFDFKFKNMIIS